MTTKQPNIVFILCDDHAAHAISAYGSRVNHTPHIDRIAHEGMRFDNCFCTNSICTPSRASIITGTYNHINGCTTLATNFDNTQRTYLHQLQDAGYQTAMFGKWHLGEGPEHEPKGVDTYCVVPGQGDYHNPTMIENGVKKKFFGYTTNIITDLSADFMRRCDRERPFAVMVHHKAPHRHWEPEAKYKNYRKDEFIPLPATFDDDYEGRPAAEAATMRIDRDMFERDYKEKIPEGLSDRDRKIWIYQRYMHDYLACVQSVDDCTGRLLDMLDDMGIADDTIVIYTSDQGFYLGDHGWYDKRFMYEESLGMPLLVRYPKMIKPGTVNHDIVLNVDFAQTFCELTGSGDMPGQQGRSLVPLLEGTTPSDWRTCMYYRYWMHNDNPHNVWSHYGLRTERYKLIYFYCDGLGIAGCRPNKDEPRYYELYDLLRDPCEMHNVINEPAYAKVFAEMRPRLREEMLKVRDTPHPSEDQVQMAATH
jgi:arylsulfatase A-like enzyme